MSVLPRITRRQFLAGGGALVVAFSIPARALAQAREAAPKLPGALERTPMLDAWIRIDADGRITVFTGKAELGQGVRTALSQIAAEQLAIAFERVVLITADTERTPNEGYTAGSNSLKDSGTALMHAAAQAREILIAEAARRWNAPRAELTARDGVVAGPGGRTATYAELVTGQMLHARAEPDSKLIDAAARRLMGKPVQRVDIPGKVTGGVAYVQDLRLPDMVHARLVRPARPGAALRALDVDSAQRLPGVLRVVRDGNFVAVIAARESQAVRAARALSDSARWEGGHVPPEDIHAHLLSLASEDTVILDRNAPAGEGAIRASYRRPYQLHGAIGPSCAVGLMKDGKLTLWTHSQGVFPLRGAIAEMLAMAPEQVHCIHAEGSGCYGHNGADDVAADAALLARAMPGRPVRVQWMREDEHAWEPLGPAMATRASATLDANGRISAWTFDVWSNTHSSRPGNAGNLLAATLVAKPFAPPAPRPIPQPEGGGDRNAIPLYAIPSARVVSRFIPQMPLRVSALRALGAYMNVFSIESFMDELAARAAVDPVEFRLRHLDDRRAQAVVRLAAQRFGWDRFERRRGRGRGFAFARYKNLAAYCAVAMEVDVDRESGDIRVGRVVAAVDSGDAVNPDGIRNQIEGGIVQSLSWTLFEAVAWDRQRITTRDWGRYPMMRFSHVPRSVEVHVIEHPDGHFLGTGEAAQGPAAAALANAVADAGARIRDIPFTPTRVRDALR